MGDSKQKSSYEIEIKSLLGSKEKAQEIFKKMQELDPSLKHVGSHKQLNHYFIDGDIKLLADNLRSIVPSDKGGEFEEITSKASQYSIRTRQEDDRVIFVIKASVDDTSSANGIARREFEVEMKNLSLDKLDELILKSGFQYQSKWSRERNEYDFVGLRMTLDWNAGYGQVAEFERVITDPAGADQAKKHIREVMASLGVEELDQARLERMFAYYNKHWQEYYKTDKIFVIP